MMAYNPWDILAGTAILTFFGAIALYFPILGFACFMLLPLPVIFYRIKLGRKGAGIIGLISIAVIHIAGSGHAVDLWLILCMIGLGFAMGEAMEQDLSVEKTIAYPSGLIWTAGLAALVVIGNTSGSGPLEMISAYVQKNLELTATAYRNMDMPEDSVEILTGSMDRLHYVIMGILPAMTITGLIFAAWVNLLLSKIALRAGKLPWPEFGRLKEWKAPEFLVWGAIGCGLLLWLGSGPLAFIGANGLILLMLIYMFQGLAIISWYFEQKKMPVFLRTLIYLLIPIQQVLALAVVGLGFFDTWADFRKTGIKNGDSSGSS